MVRRAGTFFAEAITPIEKTHRTAREANVRLNQMVEVLHRRSADLADSNLQLKQEIAQRKAVEESLRKSERHYSQVAGAVAPFAGTIAAPVPPASVGAGGRTQTDQPRAA
jgi:C4-dicarboxylate-specific signal transduction histidine kinase